MPSFSVPSEGASHTVEYSTLKAATNATTPNHTYVESAVLLLLRASLSSVPILSASARSDVSPQPTLLRHASPPK
eukprot:3444466-Rhodomonas_salina.2